VQRKGGQCLLPLSLLAAAVAIAMMLSQVALAEGTTTTAPVTIWYIPHPDDETIGMAGAIQRSQAQNRRNIIIFFTRGGRTLSAYMQGLNIGKIKTSRMSEAKLALTTLGIPANDITFFDFEDGAVGVEGALAVMRAYHDKYPGAAHRTVSYTDPHPDHKALALALAQLQREHPELDVAFYRVYIYNKPLENRLNDRVAREPVPSLSAKAAAISAYTKTSTSDGRYAVGAMSVPKLLVNSATDPYEYRDLMPPAFGLRPVYISLYGPTVGAAAEFVNTSDWSFITRLAIGQRGGLAFRLQKVLATFPGRTIVYAGSEYHLLGNWQSRSTLLAGVGLFDRLNFEYHLHLNEELNAVGLIELRWYPGWNNAAAPTAN